MTTGTWANVEIRTTRFILKPITENDVTPSYLSWFSGRTAEHISVHPGSIEDLRTYVAERSHRPDVLFLAIYVAENERHIGNLKFEPLDRENSGAVLGIFIGDENWQGKGVAIETIGAAATWLHATLGLDQLWLGVAIENYAARRAYEKLGFKEGICSLIPQREGIEVLQLNIAE